jgi:iron complex outermembrane receptor protein/outer membrane receptor for ferrienterochelin and colicins
MKFLFSNILLFTFFVANSQTIKGTIIDAATGKGIGGASIVNIGTKKGVQADSSGKFIMNSSDKLRLVFSATGYINLDTTILAFANSNFQIELIAADGDLDEVVIVSSSRTNSRIEDLPTKVEVLGSEEVHEENGIKPGNIASLLGDIAGIQIQQTNAATGNADMRIQGLQGKYTQILRDGMPLFGGYSGSFSILQIPPLDLQQIELVKGAASTLYGGGAIAGMLNLISKKPKMGKPEANLTLNRSTLLENNANLFFSGRNKKTGFTFFAGGTLQNPVDVNKDGFSDVPSVKSVFIHPRFFLYGSETSTVVLGYTLNYEDRNGGDMQALNKSLNASKSFFIQNKSWRNTADIVWEKKLKGNAQLTTKASTSFFSRDVLTNSFGMSGKQLIWYTEMAYSNKTEYHNYVMGINFNGDEFTKKLPDSTLLENAKNNTIGLFAQDDWKFHPKFTLQSGVRIDIHNNYGTYFLPRLSLMYKANQKVTMRIGGGLGYKTPTLFNAEIDERQYRYIAGYKVGTTSEKSYGANFDVNYKTNLGGWNLTFNQTFFYNRIDKPILLETLPTVMPTPVYMFMNQTQPLETAGFETYIAAHKDALELYLGYVYTNAKRKYNPAQPNLPLIARNKLATVIAYEFSKKFRAGVEAAYTGKQFLDNGKTTTPYVFAAVMMRYNIGNTSIVLNCENLFNYRQNKNNQVVFPPLNNPSFPEIWAPLDGRVVNMSVFFKLY